MNSHNESKLNSTYWSVRQTGILRHFCEDRWVLTAQLLMLLNLVAMTRAFALVSLIEFILWCLFIFYSPLRTGFLESFSDIRIKLVFAFWAWVAFATLWSSADYFLRFEEVWSWRKLLLFPMAWVLFRERRLKHIAILTLVITAGTYMFFSWAGYLGYVSLDRAPSQLLENHATQGVVFASSSLLLLIMLKSESLPTWLRLIFCLLIFGMITNIIYVITGRTAYVALLLLAPYGAWLVASRLKWVSASIVLVVISFGLYHSNIANSRVAQGIEEFGNTMSGEATGYSSMGIRWVYWENTLRMIAMKPVLGSGSGAFSADYARLVADEEGWRAEVTDDPHQEYLLIAGEQGLIGLILFLAALASFLISQGDDRNRLGALGILLMTAVNGMFNGHFGSFVEGRLFWIMMGVLLSRTAPLNSLTDVKQATVDFTVALGQSVGIRKRVD